MLHAFTVDVRDLKLNTGSKPLTGALRLSANAYRASGRPLGLVAHHGLVYNALPDNLPAFVVYEDGGAEIRTDFNLNHIVEARFIVSGSALLMKDGLTTEIVSPLNISKTLAIPRMGLGIRYDGKLLFVVNTCTAEELQLALKTLGAYDAVMLAFNEIYAEYPQEEVKMLGTTLPITVFEARTATNLKRPIVVIDAGHGGKHPGAVAFGVQEKVYTLRGANIVYMHLLNNYEGTFLMTRIDDSALELKQRSDVANAIGADFFVSLHHNAFNGQANGYETFVFRPTDVCRRVQRAVHTTVMDFLKPYDVRDRGMKEQNFHVLRETKMPSLLVETLFMDNLKDAELLKSPEFFKAVHIATAEGLAKGLGLNKKLTVEPEPEQQKLYRVQVGAFRNRQGAEDLLTRLKGAGFDGYIKRE